MCLIAWNWQPDSDTPLLLLGNRDEFYARPTQNLHRWPGEELLAGKDLEAGGTWLGIGHAGRLAALTNYRVAVADPQPKPSRGAITTGFLRGNMDARSYLEALATQAKHYNPFNLLLWDGQTLMGLESRSAHVLTLPPGMGAVSNADFNTPWPKLQQLKTGLDKQCTLLRTDVQDLLPLLQNPHVAPDGELPHTGVSVEMERMLSAVFVASDHYGTRASSVIRYTREHIQFFEQCYAKRGMLTTAQQFSTPINMRPGR